MVQQMTTKKPKRQAAKTATTRVSPTPRRAIRVGALATIADVAKEAANLYRAARQGRVPVGDAARLGYLLGVIRGCLEVASLEQRIERLEALEGKAHVEEPTRPHFAT
jgi:hypothetical protein